MSKTLLTLCLLVAACGQPSSSLPISPPPPGEARASVVTSASPEATRTPTPTPAATHIFAFPVTCGPMDPIRCEEFVEQLVEAIAGNQAGKTIETVVVVTEKGSYQLDFTDGTGVGADVD